MAHTFTITNLGKRYRVAVRARYQGTITNEKRLIQVLIQSADAQSSKRVGRAFRKAIEDGKILEVCSQFGILGYSCPVKR